MREALSALTTRGRAFLAAGGTAFLCALFLGHDELVRVGALLIVLPLATAWFLGPQPLPARAGPLASPRPRSPPDSRPGCSST